MAEKSGADINIEIAQRLQERFEAYWLGLIFTLLGASIQTAKFGVVPLADALELGAWVLLLVSGLAGLSRFEWLPEIYRLRSLQIEKEDWARAAHKEEVLRGTREVYVAPLKKSVPSAQFIAESEASLHTIEEKLAPIERRQLRKYRVKKWTFVAAVCLLIGSRAYAPFIGVLTALTR
jgi:hypothetical protein